MSATRAPSEGRTAAASVSRAVTAPSPAGLRRMARDIGNRGTPRTVRRLRGGIDATTHVIAIGEKRLVLKRYPQGAAVLPEWEATTLAYQAGIPAAEPIAVDVDGDWFDSPAIAMSLLPGAPLLQPNDRRTYADQVATSLAAVHDLSTGSLPSPLRRPHRIDVLDPAATPRTGHLAPSTVERVAAVLTKARDALAAEDRVLTHGDFHPGNLLWSRDRLTGIVDWSGTRPGPLQWELAYFRVELTVLVDRRAANAILSSYEAVTGHEAFDQPIWDLVHVLDSHVWMQSWLSAYREQGRRDLGLDTARRRLRRLAHSLLADVGG